MPTLTVPEILVVFQQHMPGIHVEVTQNEGTYEIEVRMRYGIIETMRVVETPEPQRQVELLQGLAQRVQGRAFVDLGMEEMLREERRKQVSESVNRLKKRVRQFRESAETTLVPGAREVYYAQMGTMSEAIEILETR